MRWSRNSLIGSDITCISMLADTDCLSAQDDIAVLTVFELLLLCLSKVESLKPGCSNKDLPESGRDLYLRRKSDRTPRVMGYPEISRN